MKPKCETRNHRWDKGAKEGSRCLDCKKEFGVRTRKKAAEATPAPAQSQQAQPVRAPNEALRAKWGLPNPAQPAQAAQPAQTASPEPEPEKKPDETKVDVGELIREGIPDLVIGAEQKTIRWMGVEPDEPHPKLKEKFDESFEKFCRSKVRIEVPPLWAMLITGVAMGLQMYITGDKIEPSHAATRGSADGTAARQASSPSPPNSSQTRNFSLIQGDGDATNAPESSSGE